MTKRRCIVYFLGLMLILGVTVSSHSQADLSVEEVIEKNIQAFGGKEKLAHVKNFSFRTGTTSYYMSSDGRMKIAAGKDPVITEVILVDKEKVKRNCFNEITEFSGIQKSTYQTLALLQSGLFTLMKFKGQLKNQGLKKFGPKYSIPLYAAWTIA